MGCEHSEFSFAMRSGIPLTPFAGDLQLVLHDIERCPCRQGQPVEGTPNSQERLSAAYLLTIDSHFHGTVEAISG